MVPFLLDLVVLDVGLDPVAQSLKATNHLLQVTDHLRVGELARSVRARGH